jgi:tetratricopeptide (TPR) repeat protein
MNHKLLVSGLLAVVFFSLASAQAQNNGGGSSGVDKNAAAATGTGAGAHFDQTLNEQVGSMRFIGKVVVAGGQLPWDPIPVVVNCDGKVKYYTLTDKKGGFGISASSRESEGVRSARDPKHVDPSQFVGCKVSAVLEGFQSTVVTIANGSIMDSPDLGTITLSQDARATGSVVSATIATAQPEALKELEKAQADEINRNFGSAKKHLQRALSIDPKIAEAWYHLGKLEEKDKPQEALEAFKKSAACDPKYIPPYEHIAALAATQQRWQDVADAANHALELNPAGTPQIWYFSAVGNYNIGANGLAETSALNALAMDPNHIAAPKTEDQLAVILAKRGAYAEALEHLRHYLVYASAGSEADLVKQQIAQLEKVLPKSAK